MPGERLRGLFDLLAGRRQISTGSTRLHVSDHPIGLGDGRSCETVNGLRLGATPRQQGGKDGTACRYLDSG
jgi:hypothetical protein